MANDSAGEVRSPFSFEVLRREAARRLKGAVDLPELESDLLLAHVARVPRSTVIANPERELDATDQAALQKLVVRRAEGVPLAYLTGWREFFDLKLEVRPGVLVPRPETEWLVDKVLELRSTILAAGSQSGPRVLDLGTGSGAIALAVKNGWPELCLTGADISPESLDVARANAERLGLDLEWVESDWFSSLGGRQFDAIVCNPPYVASGDPHFAGPLRFEPRLALDGGSDGLDAYREILRTAPEHLRPNGRLLIEHGFDQQQSLLDMAAAHGWVAQMTYTDPAGHDRCIVWARPKATAVLSTAV